MARNTRPINWVKAARKAFEDFPSGAREVILVALTAVADGAFPANVKPMKGLGSGVYEVALRLRTDAYRAVYTVQFADAVWVVHAFQKKSKTGIGTPRQEIDVVIARLKRLTERLQ